MARLQFITDITGVVPTPWSLIEFSNNKYCFWGCKTEDSLNGVYITAHNFEVVYLCKEKVLQNMDFIIANTCIFREELDTDILRLLRKRNKDVVLWYAKQEIEMTEDHIFRKTNTINDVGNFGFFTSKSDRLMFRYRKRGFLPALELAFDKVAGLYGIDKSGVKNGKIY